MHHHSSPLALDTRNSSSASTLSPGSLSFSSSTTATGGDMAAVASQKEHQLYPPTITDPQQHHAHAHTHHQQHHQEPHNDSMGRVGGMHLSHQQSSSNYLHQSSPPPLTSSSSSSVAALQRIAASASLDPVASQSTSLALSPVTSGIDHQHSHHHSFSSSNPHSQLHHQSSNQQHHVHQRHPQQQHQQHYHQDRTSPEGLSSADPSNNDNNNGKNSSSDSSRELSRNMGSSNGGSLVKKGDGDHGGGSISHHAGGHHQTTAASGAQHHHSSPAPLDRTYSSHTSHHVGHEEELSGGHNTANAQYLSANCVIFTYFDKNISEAVNEHFSRSELFRDSSSVGAQGNSPSSPSSIETEKNKGCLPMSQRNFPASFWNSDYQYPASSVSGASGAASSLSSLAMGHAALISGHHTAADIYGAAAHDPYANLFGYGAAGNTTGNSTSSSTDPWQNYMAAGMGAAAYASQRSAAHDMYSAATAAHSRHAAAASAQSHYSSLLQLQNTMRQASMAGSVAAGGLQGRAAASAIDGYAAGSAHSHYGAAGLTAGLEGTMQGSSKELSYWGF